jgi:hypothetical protein
LHPKCWVGAKRTKTEKGTSAQGSQGKMDQLQLRGSHHLQSSDGASGSLHHHPSRAKEAEGIMSTIQPSHIPNHHILPTPFLHFRPRNPGNHPRDHRSLFLSTVLPPPLPLYKTALLTPLLSFHSQGSYSYPVFFFLSVMRPQRIQ